MRTKILYMVTILACWAGSVMGQVVQVTSFPNSCYDQTKIDADGYVEVTYPTTSTAEFKFELIKGSPFGLHEVIDYKTENGPNISFSFEKVEASIDDNDLYAIIVRNTTNGNMISSSTGFLVGERQKFNTSGATSRNLACGNAGIIEAKFSGGVHLGDNPNFHFELTSDTGHFVDGYFDGWDFTIDAPITGIYTLVVTSDKGGTCERKHTFENLSVTVSGGLKVIEVKESVPVACNGDDNGIAYIEITGITGSYAYFFLDGTPYYDIQNGVEVVVSNLSGGKHTLEINEWGGQSCSVIYLIEIAQPVAPIASFSNKQDPKCKDDSEGGSVEITVSAGTPSNGYIFTATPPVASGLSSVTANIASQTGTGPFTVVLSGLRGDVTYNLTGMNGTCNIDITPNTVELEEPDPFDFTLSDPTPPTCLGINDGTITINNTSGYATTYRLFDTKNGTATWNDASPVTPVGGIIIQGLAAGTYVIFGRNANECEHSQTITIDPATPLSMDVTLVSPTTGYSGSMPTGITAECAGTFSFNADNISRDTGKGVLNWTLKNGAVTVENGTGNVEVGTTQFPFTISESGDYSVEIKYAFYARCDAFIYNIGEIEIPEPISFSRTFENASCVGGDGTITVNIDNPNGDLGVTDYVFPFNFTIKEELGNNSFLFTVPSNNDTPLSITNITTVAPVCAITPKTEADASALIQAPVINITGVTPTPPDCNEEDGSVTIDVTYTFPPAPPAAPTTFKYVFTDTDDTEYTFLESPSFSNDFDLPAGIYDYKLEYREGCTPLISTFEIKQTAPIEVTVVTNLDDKPGKKADCPGDPAIITFTVEGEPERIFSYVVSRTKEGGTKTAITEEGTTESLEATGIKEIQITHDNTLFGKYTYEITVEYSDYECDNDEAETTIEIPEPVTFSRTIDQHADCPLGQGTVTITVQNGGDRTGNGYNFSLTGGHPENADATNNFKFDLDPDTYTITISVVPATSCPNVTPLNLIDASVEIEAPKVEIKGWDIVTPVTCNGGDGRVKLDVEWYVPSQPNTGQTALPLALTFTFKDGDREVTRQSSTTANSTGDYSPEFNLPAGSYTVTATVDAKTCITHTYSSVLLIEEPLPTTIDISTDKTDDTSDCAGEPVTITFTVNGEPGNNFTYSWTATKQVVAGGTPHVINSQGTPSGQFGAKDAPNEGKFEFDVEHEFSGTYEYVITVNDGCPQPVPVAKTKNITVTVPEAITYTLSDIENAECIGEKGAVTINITNPNDPDGSKGTNYTFPAGLGTSTRRTNTNIFDFEPLADTYNIGTIMTAGTPACEVKPAEVKHATLIIREPEAFTAPATVSEFTSCSSTVTLDIRGGFISLDPETPNVHPPDFKYFYTIEQILPTSSPAKEISPSRLKDGSIHTPEFDLEVGSYIIRVKYNEDCDDENAIAVTIEDAEAITIDKVEHDPVICHTDGTKITITATGQQPTPANGNTVWPLEYSIDGGATWNNLTGVFNISGPVDDPGETKNFEIMVKYQADKGTTIDGETTYCSAVPWITPAPNHYPVVVPSEITFELEFVHETCEGKGGEIIISSVDGGFQPTLPVYARYQYKINDGPWFYFRNTPQDYSEYKVATGNEGDPLNDVKNQTVTGVEPEAYTVTVKRIYNNGSWHETCPVYVSKAKDKNDFERINPAPTINWGTPIVEHLSCPTPNLDGKITITPSLTHAPGVTPSTPDLTFIITHRNNVAVSGPQYEKTVVADNNVYPNVVFEDLDEGKYQVIAYIGAGSTCQVPYHTEKDGDGKPIPKLITVIKPPTIDNIIVSVAPQKGGLFCDDAATQIEITVDLTNFLDEYGDLDEFKGFDTHWKLAYRLYEDDNYQQGAPDWREITTKWETFDAEPTPYPIDDMFGIGNYKVEVAYVNLNASDEYEPCGVSGQFTFEDVEIKEITIDADDFIKLIDEKLTCGHAEYSMDLEVELKYIDILHGNSDNILLTLKRQNQAGVYVDYDMFGNNKNLPYTVPFKFENVIGGKYQIIVEIVERDVNGDIIPTDHCQNIFTIPYQTNVLPMIIKDWLAIPPTDCDIPKMGRVEVLVEGGNFENLELVVQRKLGDGWIGIPNQLLPESDRLNLNTGIDDVVGLFFISDRLTLENNDDLRFFVKDNTTAFPDCSQTTEIEFKLRSFDDIVAVLKEIEPITHVTECYGAAEGSIRLMLSRGTGRYNVEIFRLDDANDWISQVKYQNFGSNVISDASGRKEFNSATEIPFGGATDPFLLIAGEYRVEITDATCPDDSNFNGEVEITGIIIKQVPQLEILNLSDLENELLPYADLTYIACQDPGDPNAPVSGWQLTVRTTGGKPFVYDDSIDAETGEYIQLYSNMYKYALTISGVGVGIFEIHPPDLTSATTPEEARELIEEWLEENKITINSKIPLMDPITGYQKQDEFDNLMYYEEFVISGLEGKDGSGNRLDISVPWDLKIEVTDAAACPVIPDPKNIFEREMYNVDKLDWVADGVIVNDPVCYGEHAEIIVNFRGGILDADKFNAFRLTVTNLSTQSPNKTVPVYLSQKALQHDFISINEGTAAAPVYMTYLKPSVPPSLENPAGIPGTPNFVVNADNSYTFTFYVHYRDFPLILNNPSPGWNPVKFMFEINDDNDDCPDIKKGDKDEDPILLTNQREVRNNLFVHEVAFDTFFDGVRIEHICDDKNKLTIIRLEPEPGLTQVNSFWEMWDYNAQDWVSMSIPVSAITETGLNTTFKVEPGTYRFSLGYEITLPGGAKRQCFYETDPPLSIYNHIPMEIDDVMDEDRIDAACDGYGFITLRVKGGLENHGYPPFNDNQVFKEPYNVYNNFMVTEFDSNGQQVGAPFQYEKINEIERFKDLDITGYPKYRYERDMNNPLDDWREWTLITFKLPESDYDQESNTWSEFQISVSLSLSNHIENLECPYIDIQPPYNLAGYPSWCPLTVLPCFADGDAALTDISDRFSIKQQQPDHTEFPLLVALDNALELLNLPKVAYNTILEHSEYQHKIEGGDPVIVDNTAVWIGKDYWYSYNDGAQCFDSEIPFTFTAENYLKDYPVVPTIMYQIKGTRYDIEGKEIEFVVAEGVTKVKDESDVWFTLTTDLPVGEYTVYIKDLDNGCYITYEFEIGANIPKIRIISEDFVYDPDNEVIPASPPAPEYEGYVAFEITLIDGNDGTFFDVTLDGNDNPTSILFDFINFEKVIGGVRELDVTTGNVRDVLPLRWKFDDAGMTPGYVIPGDLSTPRTRTWTLYVFTKEDDFDPAAEERYINIKLILPSYTKVSDGTFVSAGTCTVEVDQEVVFLEELDLEIVPLKPDPLSWICDVSETIDVEFHIGKEGANFDGFTMLVESWDDVSSEFVSIVSDFTGVTIVTVNGKDLISVSGNNGKGLITLPLEEGLYRVTVRDTEPSVGITRQLKIEFPKEFIFDDEIEKINITHVMCHVAEASRNDDDWGSIAIFFKEPENVLERYSFVWEDIAGGPPAGAATFKFDDIATGDPHLDYLKLSPNTEEDPAYVLNVYGRFKITVLDAKGDPIPILDANGDPVLDENNDPTYYPPIFLDDEFCSDEIEFEVKCKFEVFIQNITLDDCHCEYNWGEISFDVVLINRDESTFGWYDVLAKISNMEVVINDIILSGGIRLDTNDPDYYLNLEDIFQSVVGPNEDFQETRWSYLLQFPSGDLPGELFDVIVETKVIENVDDGGSLKVVPLGEVNATVRAEDNPVDIYYPEPISVEIDCDATGSSPTFKVTGGYGNNYNVKVYDVTNPGNIIISSGLFVPKYDSETGFLTHNEIAISGLPTASSAVYEIVIGDKFAANGCSEALEFRYPMLASSNITVVSSTNALCAQQPNGIAVLSLPVGFSIADFTFSPGGVKDLSLNRITITGLTAGSNTISVLDDKDKCKVPVTRDVIIGVERVVAIPEESVRIPAFDCGESKGYVEFEVVHTGGFTPEVTFSNNDGAFEKAEVVETISATRTKYGAFFAAAGEVLLRAQIPSTPCFAEHLIEEIVFPASNAPIVLTIADVSEPDQTCRATTKSYEFSLPSGSDPTQYKLAYDRDGVEVEKDLEFNARGVISRTNLREGAYVFTVRNEAGCKVFESEDINITMPRGIPLAEDLLQAPIGHESCEGFMDGNIRLRDGYVYTWAANPALSGSLNAREQNRLVAGVYRLDVTNMDGSCKVEREYEVRLEHRFEFNVYGNGSGDYPYTAYCPSDAVELVGNVAVVLRNGNDAVLSSLDRFTGEWRNGGVQIAEFSLPDNNILSIATPSEYSAIQLYASFWLTNQMGNPQRCQGTHTVEIIELDQPSLDGLRDVLYISDLAESYDLAYRNLPEWSTYVWLADPPQSGINLPSEPSEPFPLTLVPPTRPYNLTLRLWGDMEEGVEAACETAHTIRVETATELQIPNAFTPNGDGIHDLWTFRNIEKYTELFNIEVEVFNRAGMLVFEHKGYNDGVAWNGQRNQNDVPIATYWYIVKIVPKSTTRGVSRELTGTVSIIR